MCDFLAILCNRFLVVLSSVFCCAISLFCLQRWGCMTLSFLPTRPIQSIYRWTWQGHLLIMRFFHFACLFRGTYALIGTAWHPAYGDDSTKRRKRRGAFSSFFYMKDLLAWRGGVVQLYSQILCYIFIESRSLTS